MFRFEYIGYLWLLLGIPILAYIIIKNKKFYGDKLSQWGNPTILEKLSKGLEQYRPHRWLALLSGLIAVIIALANPQWGQHNENLQSNAADVYIALDISKSMDVEDVAPSRILKSKKMAMELVQALKGHNIGLILFAGSAYLQIPLTSDYAAVIMMINVASTESAGSQGTNIKAVADIVKRASEKQGQHGGHLVILTDGEDHEGEAINAIEELTKNGFTTFSIGAGTSNGGYIKEGLGYKLDENNNPIISKLNVEMINDIAKSGQGSAFGLEDNNAIKAIVDAMNMADKSTKSSKLYNQFNSYYQLFLVIAIVFFIIEYIISKWYHLQKSKA